jgi:hypothetical protein
MASLTRDEFLSHVHPGLVRPDIALKRKTSPTKSTQRYRWHELLLWDVEAEARAYWDAVRGDDKTAVLPVAGYWGIAQLQLDSFFQQLISELGLRVPFSNAFQISHHIAIGGAHDVHAEMWTEGSQADPQPVANADLIMVYYGRLCGLIELKTWWKVTEVEIEQVRQGNKQPHAGLSNERSRTFGRSASWPFRS